MPNRVTSLLWVTALGLTFAACAPSGPSTAAVQPPEHPPAAGDWVAATDFGRMTLTIDKAGASVTYVTYEFSDWTCGTASYSGELGSGAKAPLTDNKFGLTQTLNMDAKPTMEIDGTYQPDSQTFSGSWHEVASGTKCDGTWEAVPPGTHPPTLAVAATPTSTPSPVPPTPTKDPWGELYDQLCIGSAAVPPEFGTSTTKRAFDCSGVMYGVDTGDVLSLDPGEIWFILDRERIPGQSKVPCSGFNRDTGKSFGYSYLSGGYNTVSLKEVHTGKVVATKSFWDTPPRCVFASCTLNLNTNIANCSGGEAKSTLNADAIKQWMTGVLK